MAFKFENLRVWQDSVELSNAIHELVITFPKNERYVLSSQIQRASDSISLNIAEGSTGQTNPEFKRFLGYSIRSGIEVIIIQPNRKPNKINSSAKKKIRIRKSVDRKTVDLILHL